MAFLLPICLFLFSHSFNKEICHDSTLLNPYNFEDTVRHTPRTVQEKLISIYVLALILCWGHFSASFVAHYLKNHKATISRYMRKDLCLSTLWQVMLKKVIEKAEKKAWLIIDSTIKGKRGKKLCNLQKFKTAHGYTIAHCFVSALLICEDNL